MENQKTIDTLNKLIEVNNDRIEVYEIAAKEINEPDLKTLFFQFVQISLTCIKELSSEIYTLGGIPTEGAKHTGKFFWKWMDVKAALSANDFKAILNACKYAEKQAITVYKNVLTDDIEHLSHAQQNMIRNQFSLIKSGRSTVKLMRHVLL